MYTSFSSPGVIVYIQAHAPHTRTTRHFYGLQIGNGVLKFGGDRVRGDRAGGVLDAGIEVTRAHVAEILPALADAPLLGASMNFGVF